MLLYKYDVLHVRNLTHLIHLLVICVLSHGIIIGARGACNKAQSRNMLGYMDSNISQTKATNTNKINIWAYYPPSSLSPYA
jgi:hypothetical protein